MKIFIGGLGLALAAMVVPVEAQAHEGHETEELEATFYTNDFCFDYAAKFTLYGTLTVHTKESGGKATETGVFKGSFDTIILDEETGKPDKKNPLNSAGSFSESWVDRYDSDKQNKDGDYVSAVSSVWKGGGDGETASDLEYSFKFWGKERLGKGGRHNPYDDYEKNLRRFKTNLRCTTTN